MRSRFSQPGNSCHLKMSAWKKRTRDPVFRPFRMATARASSDMSQPSAVHSGKAFARARAMHPLPVPTSSREEGATFLPVTIQSTNSSVSGRGMSTAGVTSRVRP